MKIEFTEKEIETLLYALGGQIQYSKQLRKWFVGNTDTAEFSENSDAWKVLTKLCHGRFQEDGDY